MRRAAKLGGQSQLVNDVHRRMGEWSHVDPEFAALVERLDVGSLISGAAQSRL